MQKSHAAIAMFFILLLSYVLNSIDRGLFSVLAIEVREVMSGPPKEILCDLA